MGIQIVLANGTKLSPVTAASTKVNFQGANRDALEFGFAETDTTVNFDMLETLFNEYNCAVITLIDGSVTSKLEGYILKAGVQKMPVMVKAADNENPAVYETRYLVTMAQRTLIENQMASIHTLANQAMVVALDAL